MTPDPGPRYHRGTPLVKKPHLVGEDAPVYPLFRTMDPVLGRSVGRQVGLGAPLIERPQLQGALLPEPRFFYRDRN